jgi:hypothetical protein
MNLAIDAKLDMKVNFLNLALISLGGYNADNGRFAWANWKDFTNFLTLLRLLCSMLFITGQRW